MAIDAIPVRCDMPDAADIKKLVAQTVERFGGIEIVVNNASGPPIGRFEYHDDAAWLAAFEQNLMSVVRLTREALPHLKRSDQGRIINISSTGDHCQRASRGVGARFDEGTLVRLRAATQTHAT